MTYNASTSLEEGDNIPIEELDLTVRAYNCLKRSNIHTVSQLLALSKAELLGIRNFGPQNYTEVRERLIARGFTDPRSPRRAICVGGAFMPAPPIMNFNELARVS